MAVGEWTEEDEMDARALQTAIDADDGERFSMAEVMEMAKESE